MTIDFDEVPDAHTRALPAVLAGVPLERLIGWAREPGLCPSPEVREALRSPEVIAALRAHASRQRFGRPDVIA